MFSFSSLCVQSFRPCGTGSLGSYFFSNSGTAGKNIHGQANLAAPQSWPHQILGSIPHAECWQPLKYHMAALPQVLFNSSIKNFSSCFVFCYHIPNFLLMYPAYDDSGAA